MASKSRFMPRQHGFSLLVLMVGAIVLAGTLVYFLAAPRLAVNPLHQRNIAAQLVAQARYIQQQLYACATQHAEGEGQEAFTQALPVGGAGTSVGVSTLTCPGNGQSLWAGDQGNYRAQQPAGFGGWTYQTYPSTGVVNIAITSLAGRDMSQAIGMAVSKLGPAEAYSFGTPATRLYLRIVN